MGFWSNIFGGSKNQEFLEEALKPFDNDNHSAKALKIAKRRSGEGVRDWGAIDGAIGYFGGTDVKGYNSFHKKYIDSVAIDNQQKIVQYRNIARYPEVADVIEDIVNESTQIPLNGNMLNLVISDPTLSTNENMAKVITEEFSKVFFHRIQIHKIIDELLMTYFIDGKVFCENIIDSEKPKNGIIGLKKLPTETMDYSWNPITNAMNFYVQYIKQTPKLPPTFEDAKKDENCIAFYPDQITFLDYGVYGPYGKKDVIGYLEKAKQPYNQLRLIETSIIIYRLVRSPERLVFKIDTGNMPLDKAMKFVDKVKRSLQQKVFYDPNTGSIGNQPNVMCIRLNSQIPLKDGTCITLKDLIQEHKEGKKFEVFSYDIKNKKHVYGKVKHALITRPNEQLIRITFDSGHYIDTTLDHKFIMVDGKEVQAQMLKPWDTLLSFSVEIKVAMTQILQDREDVGCIEVEDYHNFAISGTGRPGEPLVYIKNSIIENYILPQCLDLSNEIQLVNDSKKSLRDVIEDFNNGIKHKVVSVNQDTKEIIEGEIEWAGITRKNATLVEVTFTSGDRMKCTPDHKFVLENGDEKDAQYLMRHDDLMPYNGKKLRVKKVTLLAQRKDTGCLIIKDPGNNHNFLLAIGVFVKNSASGRGSNIESVGGNPAGFAELDDLYFFQKKLYKALKYPMSRVERVMERASSEVKFADSSGEIARDEIKWGRFLKKHQDKFCESFLDLFMLHLQFTGLKKEFGIRRDMLHISMTTPNNYIALMQQYEFDKNWENYSTTDHPEFSKYWRMKRILKLTDEEIEENIKFLQKDKDNGLTASEDKW